MTIPETHLQGVLDIWEESGTLTACHTEGNCMSPMIREGDTVVIRHGADDIRVGDIVVFGSPGSFYVHRVVRISGPEADRIFLLKGDRNPTYNNPVSRREIVGKVIEIQGSDGHLRLESSFWRSLNRLLSIRSDFAARRNGAGTVLWRIVNRLHVFKSAIIPRRFSIGRVLWRATCRVYRIWNSIRTYGLVKETGE